MSDGEEEPATQVDALFAIAEALNRLAEVCEDVLEEAKVRIAEERAQDDAD